MVRAGVPGWGLELRVRVMVRVKFRVSLVFANSNTHFKSSSVVG